MCHMETQYVRSQELTEFAVYRIARRVVTRREPCCATLVAVSKYRDEIRFEKHGNYAALTVASYTAHVARCYPYYTSRYIFYTLEEMVVVR